MNLYRLTRPEIYEPGCPGHTKPSARQGRYVEAETPEQAIAEMVKHFPQDTEWDVQTDGPGSWESKPATRYRKHGDVWLSDDRILTKDEFMRLALFDELPQPAGQPAPSDVVESRCPSCEEHIPLEHVAAIAKHHGLA